MNLNEILQLRIVNEVIIRYVDYGWEQKNMNDRENT